MLENYFAVPAAAERLRTSVFGPHLDTFCGWLADRGYKGPTIRHKLWVVTSAARWMEDERVGVNDLDEHQLDAFVEARRGRGRTVRGFGHTLGQLLELLRSAGVARMPDEVALDDSPMATLLRRYDAFLRNQRGLADSTIAAYKVHARALVAYFGHRERSDRTIVNS